MRTLILLSPSCPFVPSLEAGYNSINSSFLNFVEILVNTNKKGFMRPFLESTVSPSVTGSKPLS